MDISKFDDSTIHDAEIYYYKNTDGIDFYTANLRYSDIEWDDMCLK